MSYTQPWLWYFICHLTAHWLYCHFYLNLKLLLLSPMTDYLHTSISEDDRYQLTESLKYAVAYLRKMKQWNDGKIDLAVEGTAPPLRMDNDEIATEKDKALMLIERIEGLL